MLQYKSKMDKNKRFISNFPKEVPHVDSLMEIFFFHSLFNYLKSKGRLLLCLLNGHCLSTLVQLRLGLESHDSASPLAYKVRVIIVLLLREVLQQIKLGLVCLVHSGESDNRRGLQDVPYP